MGIGMWGKFQASWQDSFHQADVIMAIMVLGLLLVLVIPLPPAILDFLLCLNLVFSVMSLLLALYAEKSLDFSSFPSALLFLTLYRLGLNVASTRMILTQGQAGSMIATFGEFVTGGHIAIGLVVFGLLTLINFMVVTKGAGRVAEVAARFTLEALPGKQIAIEAELNAGLISQQEARAQHEKIEQEANFFGAMDGASKFVKGDALAGLIIIGINILAGWILGVTHRGLTLTESWYLFTRLTVGEGLVCQVPSLLVSIASAVMVTRSSQQNLGVCISRDFGGHPQIFVMAGLFLLVLGCVPGMPFFIMVPISACLFLYARAIKGHIRSSEKSSSTRTKTLELELGAVLAAAILPIKSSLSQELKEIESRLGVRLPICQVRDNLKLPASGFDLRLGGLSILKSRSDTQNLIEKVSQALRAHAHDFICRQEVCYLVEKVRQSDGSVLKELADKKVSTGQILIILQGLLKEGISIRDLTAIFEALADYAATESSFNTDHALQKVRERLSGFIAEKYLNDQSALTTIRLDSKVEKMIQLSLEQSAKLGSEKLRPQMLGKLVQSLTDLQQVALQDKKNVILVCQSDIRQGLKQLLEPKLPGLPILAFSEIPSHIQLPVLGIIGREVIV
jgi:flagellar biosynthesis protein FlhA